MKTDSQLPQDVIAELNCSHPMDVGDGNRSRLPAFFALAFAWSWTCWLLAPAIKARSALAAGVLSGLGGFRPGLAAAAVVGYGGGRAALRAWLGHCLQWRIGWQWFALAFFLPLALMVSAAVIHVALGGALGASPVAGHLPLAAANLVLMHTAVNWWAWVVPGLPTAGGSRQFALLLGLLALPAIGLLAWPNRRAWAARPSDSKD